MDITLYGALDSPSIYEGVAFFTDSSIYEVKVFWR